MATSCAVMWIKSVLDPAQFLPLLRTLTMAPCLTQPCRHCPLMVLCHQLFRPSWRHVAPVVHAGLPLTLCENTFSLKGEECSDCKYCMLSVFFDVPYGFVRLPYLCISKLTGYALVFPVVLVSSLVNLFPLVRYA